jgi:hypothetical protein
MFWSPWSSDMTQLDLFVMGQNQAVASIVKKQMGHSPHEVNTLKNKVKQKMQRK